MAQKMHVAGVAANYGVNYLLMKMNTRLAQPAGGIKRQEYQANRGPYDPQRGFRAMP